jgi:prepilin peptidase CpaA
MLLSLPLYVFPLCMLAAAVSDIRKFIIPNSVSLVLIAGFFLCFAVSGLGFDVLLNHVLTGIGMLALGIALFAFRVCGAGDSKLLAAGALWLGWPVFGTALIYIALFGGILSAGIICARLVARYVPQLSTVFPPLARLAATEKLIAPYGVAIAVGSIWVFPQSALFQALTGAAH